MTLKEDTLRKSVYAFHEKRCDKPKTFTINHFEAEGVPRSMFLEEDGKAMLQRKTLIKS